MSSDEAIRCLGLGKAYQLYARRTDQVKQMLFGSFHRFYLEYWVLRDIDLEMQRGESVGIIGRNGAGKTTLLRLMCGITQPTCGEIKVAGRIAPILALGAAFDWEMTGRQNVLISGAVLGLRRSDILRRVPSIAEFAAIGPFIDQPVRLYSAGMRSRFMAMGGELGRTTASAFASAPKPAVHSLTRTRIGGTRNGGAGSSIDVRAASTSR